MVKIHRKDKNSTVWVRYEKPNEGRKWYKVDATDKVLGRLARDIAIKLMGKHKPYYSPFWDVGDFVVVENVDKLKFTGNKLKKKYYYSHSGYKGHLKIRTLEEMLVKNPEKVLRLAVRGMLPKNKLRKARMKRLKIFTGTTNKFDHFKPINLYDGKENN